MIGWKIAAVALAGLALSAGSAVAQDREAMNRLLMQSAATEWVFDNCENPEFDAGYLLAAQSVLEGMGPAGHTARKMMADLVAERFDDQAAACAEMEWVALPD